MTSSIPNPDVLYNPGPARIEAMPEILQLEKLDQLAGVYEDMLAAPGFASTTGPDIDAIEQRIADAKHRLLDDAGFVVEGSDRTEEETEAYEFADGVLDRVIRSSKDNWMGHTTADGGHDGLRNQVFRELLGRYYKPRRAVEDDPVSEAGDDDAPEQREAVERLESLRTAKHDAFVARMKGPAFGKKRRAALQQAYEDAERAYMVALGVQNKRDIDAKRIELEAEGKTGDELSAGLKVYAKQQAESVLKDDQEQEHRLLVERSGKMGKFLEWYGNASLGKKVAAGAGLAALSLATGAGIGVLAGMAGGLVGAGIATATGYGLTRGWGAARTYHLRMAELYKFPMHHEKLSFEDGDSDDTLHIRQRQFLEKVFKDQLENGDRVKKRAVRWSLGVVAVGGALGVGAHMLADGGADHLLGGQTQHWWETRTPSSPTSPGGSAPIDAHPNEGTLPGSGSRGYPEELPGRQGGDKNEVIKEYIAEHTAARNISSGEGWYQTFKELGVKSGKWDELLQEIGPKLHNIRYEGVRAAYWDTNAREWRINMTENGKMSPKVLRLIVEHANEQGYLKNPLDFSQTGGTSTEIVQPSAVAQPAESVLPNERYTSVAIEQLINKGDSAAANMVGDRGEYLGNTFNQLREAGIVDIPRSQYGAFMRQVGPELHKLQYSDGTPVAALGRHNDWYVYSSPDGRILPEALRVIARYADRNNYTVAA